MNHFILIAAAGTNFWGLIPLFGICILYFYMSNIYGITEAGESSQVKMLRKFFNKQENRYGNIFSKERTTTLPDFFKGVALASTGQRFTVNRTYGNDQINIMRDNYIAKLLDKSIKRFPLEQIAEFIEVQGRITKKRSNSFWGGNKVDYIKAYQRAYSYYSALIQVIAYEKK
jgi:hypothetical protein